MVTQAKRDRIIRQIVKLLFEEEANEWSIQDKGVLLAAVKLQLRERKAEQGNGSGGAS